MIEFRMPSLGADMEAGTLVEWLKQPGDELHKGDIIAVVETQKGAIEVEVFDQGRLKELLVGEGATVPVGTPLALIEGEAAAAPAAAPPKPAAAPTPAAAPAPPVAPTPAPVAAPERPPLPAGAVRASPAARRLAADRGIDLARLAGSGPGGAILRSDVEQALAGAAAPAPAAAPAARKAKPRGLDPAAMRQAIAAAMARSKREIPHYYVSTTIDLGAALDHLAGLNEQRPPTERILLSVPLLKAVALALRKFPEFNGVFEDGSFRPSQAIHCGAAVALRGGGLIAPAIHDTDRCDLGELMARFRDLVQRARSGGLRSSELSDPTITVSSLGERGVETIFAVIYPPQVAIVGFGTPVVRPWVRDGRIEPRTVVTASLAADHRVSDGHRGALLLAEVARLLQEPEGL